MKKERDIGLILMIVGMGVLLLSIGIESWLWSGTKSGDYLQNISPMNYMNWFYYASFFITTIGVVLFIRFHHKNRS